MNDRPAANPADDRATVDPPLAPGDRETVLPPESSDPNATLDPHPPAFASSPTMPMAVGRFQVREFLGEGVFGAVLLAYDPQLDREVALKVAKAEALAPERVERFRREARASAGLRHPNIVPLFEAGEAGGQFYLASAYVPGTTLEDALHERMDAGGFTPREAADVARKLADALAYAHGQGLVHRDVKSANVMLDPQGEPHLLDFGLALRYEGRERMTQDGSVLGTPAYMAPEVAKGNRAMWSPATDQYALGIILYELLTGHTPFSGPLEVVLYLHQTKDPEPPSKFNPAVPRDLEAVCLRCLEKDPARRYDDCQALADDLRRWLGGESTLARPTGAVEQVWKWAVRHPSEACLSASVVAVFLAGFAGVTWQWFEADRARHRAEAAEGDARRSATEARQSEATAKAVERFLISDLLASAAPEKAQGRKITVDEVLADASQRLGKTFADQPEIDAGIRRALGNSFRSLGNYPRAEPHLRRALDLRRGVLGPEHPETLEAAYDWAQLLHAEGKWAEAEAAYRQLVDSGRKALGADEPLTLRALSRLALLLQDRGQPKEAEDLFRDVLATRRRVSGERDPDTFGTMNDLAILLQARNRLPEAEGLLTRTLDLRREVLGPSHPETLESMNNLAVLRQGQGRWAEAKALYEQVLEERRRVLGPTHPDSLSAVNNLAQLLRSHNKLDEAAPLYREAVDGFRQALGPEHPNTLTATNNLAVLYLQQGNLDGAEPLFRTVLDLRRKSLGEEHEATLQTRNNLAALLYRRKKFDEAEPMMRAAWEARLKTLGPTHPDTLQSAVSLFRILQTRRKSTAAEELCRDVEAACRRTLGPDDLSTLDFADQLAEVLLDQARWDDAAPLLARVLAGRRKALGDKNPKTFQALDNMGWLLKHQNKPAEAEHCLRDSLAGRKAVWPQGHPSIALTQIQLAELLAEQGKVGDAETLLSEAVATCASIRLPPGHWLYVDVEGTRGVCLLAREEYSKAEPLVLDTYRKLKAAVAPAPRVLAAWERVGRLYDASGRPDQAAEWRAARP